MYIYISIYLSIYLSMYLSLYLSIYLSRYLPTYLPTYLSVYLSIHLSIFLFFYLSIYLSRYLPTYLPIYLSTYLPTYVSIYLSISLSCYLSIYLSIYRLNVSFVDAPPLLICWGRPFPWPHPKVNKLFRRSLFIDAAVWTPRPCSVCGSPRLCRCRERCLLMARFGRWPLAWRKIWAVLMFDLAV